MLRRLLALATPLVALLVLAPGALAATCYDSLFVGDAASGVERIVGVADGTFEKRGRVVVPGAGAIGPLLPSRDGQRLFAADPAGQRVLALDASTLAIVDAVAIGNPGGPTALALTPDGRHLLIANRSAGTVTSVRATDLEPISTATGLADVESLAVTPDGARLLAGRASASDGTTVVAAPLRDGAIVSSSIASVPVDITGPTASESVVAIIPTRSATEVLLVVRGSDASALIAMAIAPPYAQRTAAASGARLDLATAPTGLVEAATATANDVLAYRAASGGLLEPTPWSPADTGAVAAGAGVVGLGAAADGSRLIALLAPSGTPLAMIATADGAVTVADTAAGAAGIAATSLAVCPRTPPDPPSAISVAAGNRSVAISWTAPLLDGGSAVTGYVATASPGGATCETTGATACTIAGLANGTAYRIAVAAANALGVGPSAAASRAVTPRRDLAPAALAIERPRVRVLARSIVLTTRATVDGRGRIALAAVRAGRRVCSATRLAAAAGAYRVTCRLGAAERDLLRRARMTLRVHVTFTPRNGNLAAATSRLAIPRRR